MFRNLMHTVAVVSSLLTFTALPTCAAVYYASPTGGGDGSSEDSAAPIAECVPRLQPGDTLILLDGTYTGDGSMLHVEGPVTGTAEEPITIRAQNDGKVLMDGEGERWPVRLHQTEHITVEGVNACRSRGTVVNVSRSNHCTVRRVCGWDAADGNTNIFGVHYGDHNLIEDCAGWGVARKTYSCSQNGNYTTFRRCWGRWEGCTNVGPKMVMTVSYNSHNTLVENCIGTWDGQKMPETYVIHNHGEPYTAWRSRPQEPVTMTDYGVDQPYGIFGIDTRDGPNVRLYGCIAYRLADQRVVNHIANFFISRNEGSPAHMADCVSFVEPGAPPVRNFLLTYVDAKSLSAVGAEPGSFGSGDMQNVLVLEQPDRLIEQHGHLLRADDGAQVWYRYHDGQLTDEPLWPWPMNDRILELIGVDVTRTVFELGGGRLPQYLQ